MVILTTFAWLTHLITASVTFPQFIPSFQANKSLVYCVYYVIILLYLLDMFFLCIFHKCAIHIQTTVTLYWYTWLFLMIVPCKFSQGRLFPASPFLFLNVLFCTTDSRNLLDLEWQIGIWLCSVLCTWLLLPYFWSNLISRTDWKIRQSLPLLSVSLIPMGHNFIFS